MISIKRKGQKEKAPFSWPFESYRRGGGKSYLVDECENDQDDQSPDLAALFGKGKGKRLKGKGKGKGKVNFPYFSGKGKGKNKKGQFSQAGKSGEQSEAANQAAASGQHAPDEWTEYDEHGNQ